MCANGFLVASTGWCAMSGPLPRSIRRRTDVSVQSHEKQKREDDRDLCHVDASAGQSTETRSAASEGDECQSHDLSLRSASLIHLSDSFHRILLPGMQYSCNRTGTLAR